jgi:hypothetical protein
VSAGLQRSSCAPPPTHLARQQGLDIAVGIQAEWPAAVLPGTCTGREPGACHLEVVDERILCECCEGGAVVATLGECSIASEQPGFEQTSANASSCTARAPRQAGSPAVQSVTAARLVPRGLRRLSVFADGSTSGVGGCRGADVGGAAAALLATSSRQSTSPISMSPQTRRASLPTQKLHMWGIPVWLPPLCWLSRRGKKAVSART